MPNPTAAKIPTSLPKPEGNPVIGGLSEYELANLEYDRLFRSRKSQREIAGQATAVGSGPGVRILLPPAESQVSGPET